MPKDDVEAPSMAELFREAKRRPARGGAAKKRSAPSPAPAAEPSFRFVGTLETLDLGRMVYCRVFLPASLQKKAPFTEGRKLRMRGTVGGAPVALAWQFASRRHYVLVGSTLQRAAKLAVGAKVEIAFSIVSDDEVELPAELEEALRQEPDWRDLWKALTPGKQRGLAHMVASAKGEATRARRAVELLRALQEGRDPMARRPRE